MPDVRVQWHDLMNISTDGVVVQPDLPDILAVNNYFFQPLARFTLLYLFRYLESNRYFFQNLVSILSTSIYFYPKRAYER